MPKVKPESPVIEGAEYIKDLARVELKPGDVIVLRSKERIRPEFAVYLRKQLSAAFPAAKIVVIDGDLELFILRDAEAEPAIDEGGET